MKLDEAPEWAERLSRVCDRILHDAVKDPYGLLCAKGDSAYRLGKGVFGSTVTPFEKTSEDKEGTTWEASSDSGRKIRVFATIEEAADFIVSEFTKLEKKNEGENERI